MKIMPQQQVKTTIDKKLDGVYIEFSITGKKSTTKQLFFIIDNKKFDSIEKIEKVVKSGKLATGEKLNITQKKQFKRGLEKIRSYLKQHHFKEKDEINSENPALTTNALRTNHDLLNSQEFSREIIKGFLLEVSGAWLKYIFTTQGIKGLIGNNFRFSDQDLAQTLNQVKSEVLNDDSCDTFLAKNLIIAEVNYIHLKPQEASAPSLPSYQTYNQLDSFDRLKKAFIDSIHSPEMITNNQTRAMIIANRLDEIGTQLQSLDLYEIDPKTQEMKLDRNGYPIKKEDFSQQSDLDKIINEYFQNFYNYLPDFIQVIGGIPEVETNLFCVPEKTQNLLLGCISCGSSKSTEIGKY